MTREFSMPAEDERGPMTMEERAVWVYLVVFLLTAIGYAAVVVPRALSEPVAEVSWVAPMLWAIGLSVAGTIVGSILAAAASAMRLSARGRDPHVELASDERDREIERLGHRATYGVVSAALAGVLVLAMVDADAFWIGNAVYAAGCVGAVVETAVKIRAYRRGF